MSHFAKELVALAREVLASGRDQKFLKRMVELEPKSGVMAVGKGGKGRKPVKYDRAFLKRMVELEPKSGVMAVGKGGKFKKRQAFEFPSQETYDEYLKAHPRADKTLHWVSPSRLSSPPQKPDEVIEQKFGKGESFQSLVPKKFAELSHAIKEGFGNTSAGHVAKYGLDQFFKKKHPGGDVEVTRGLDGKVRGVAYTWKHENGDLEVDALASNGKVKGMGSFLIASVIRSKLKKGRNLRLSALPDADGFYDHLGMEETGINEYGGCDWQFTYDQAKKFSDFIYSQASVSPQAAPKAEEKPMPVAAGELVKVALVNTGKIVAALCEQRSYLPGDVEWTSSPKEHCPFDTGLKEMTTPTDCKCRRPWARRMRGVSGLPGESAEEMAGFHQVIQREPVTADSSLPGDESQIGEGLSLAEKERRRGRVSFKLIRALEFDTKEEMEKYQKEHEVRPETKLTVKPEGKPSSQPTEAPAQPAQTPAEQPAHQPVKHLQDNELKHRVNLKKDELHKTLSEGYYSLVSGGKNGKDPKEEKMKPDDPFFHERHLALRDELEKNGLRYTEVVGHYNDDNPQDTESTFMVFHDGKNLTDKTAGKFLVQHRSARDFSTTRLLDRLGEKFNQNSVLHSRAGRNLMVFTTGKNRGKKCGGKGWKEAPEAENFYTDIPIEGTDHTKAQLDIHECFERNMFAMALREAVKLALDDATYRWDPKHHRRPLGPGWRTAPRGWSKAEIGAQPGPVPKGGVKE